MSQQTKSVLGRRLIFNVKTLMKVTDLRAEHLCRKAGLDPGNFSKFLQGKKCMSLQTIEQLAKSLGMDPQELFSPHIGV